ncbi:acyl-CoA thioesterase [Cellulomonas denverensis]|uniref:Acyl-CoA thioesterase 2 n=1 Tax=Cellulomonas denverensis TaxID=264297 RepID=A0A7X6QZ15_9CELL|nr:acyl-CoA thioesterase II [Cellulomonas denverensis]NKY22720.1 acyl-CoA thioesterase II [Cellulomonas denverensis]GIG26183.1 acyl-CoA thioesterase II [Cellulomonas denverensis]
MTDASTSPDPADTLAALLSVLDVTPTGDTGLDFTARNLPKPGGRVFGGQVIAQALIAAGRTVPEGRLPHSLHGYFLRPGDVATPIDLTVERLRDGRSFSARRTHAAQDGSAILSMIASFQERQDGLELTEPMPDAPAPEDVESAMDRMGHMDHPVARFWTHESAFDVRHVGGSIYLGPGDPDAHGGQQVWMRTRAPLPDDQLLHRALLAHACDQIMLEPVLRRAGLSWVTPGLSVSSLDHAMWWHRDVRVDDWLLFDQRSPSAQGGRGLGATRVFDQDGTLVASIAQEGMVRVPAEG